MFDQEHWVHYIPVVTTILSAIFLFLLLRHYFARGKKPHIAWWAAGVFTYGLGTGLEGAITLLGNSIELNKAWYIAGAILGGYPLAQGSVYLHLSRKKANLLSLITVPVIVITSTLIILSPVDVSQMDSFKPTGDILVWSWIRLMTPIINIYAMIFLIGGAIYSAYKYLKSGEYLNRAIGNFSIAFGAILPAIGGSMAKFGNVEALYIGEFIGLIFIWLGYEICKRDGIASRNNKLS